jgi:hypothetical protein
MPPVTKEIETAMNRVRNRNKALGQMINTANSSFSATAVLHMGDPSEIMPETPPEPAVTPAKTPAKKPPESTLPNQTQGLVINEFEILPEKTTAKTGQRQPRRNGFGFTIGPIISVSRPKR